ncbi:hypothetical protein F4806DRAFT_507754 [Annulohypoxylon nitens]|nr:hypothetical protein F4806DRAFT_507754 [Annulohypoxylon nitens]
MADFGWLRLGQRSHVPNSPQSPPPRRELPRVPSHPNLTSPSPLSHDSLMGHGDASLIVREHDKIWYNPSLNQMVECLQVAIMWTVFTNIRFIFPFTETTTRGITQPIPIECNSYILHLIEGFAGAQERIRKVDVARTETKRSLELHLEHFKAVANEWLQREQQYKTEIKRLEVLLSRTSRDGLEAVTLARTNSVFDRSASHTKHFISKLSRLDQFGDLPNVSGKPASELSAKVLDETNDFLLSEKLRRQDAIAKTILPSSEDRLSCHATGKTQKPISDTMATGRKIESPAAPVKAPNSQPLFSDDVPDAANLGDKKLMNPGLTYEERQSRRHILENLLDCENTRSGGMPPREKVHKASSMIGLGQDEDQSITSDFRHSRGLSSTSVFSFVPGDDASAFFIKSEADDERTGAISTDREGDDSNKGITNSQQYIYEDRADSVHGLAAPTRL